jgi:small-conductance mechanosensitive channel
MDALKNIFINIFDKFFSIAISNLISSLIMVVIWIFIGIISIYIVRQLLYKIFKIKDRGPRSYTIGKLVSSISKYAIWFVIFIVILSELEIDITPFI